MLKALLILTITFLSGAELSAQVDDPTNYIHTDLISASPTAENMARYGDIPTTLYTGSANFSIPIHDHKGYDLNLPISLNYSYSGFKPAQEASWVGLGWIPTGAHMSAAAMRD